MVYNRPIWRITEMLARRKSPRRSQRSPRAAEASIFGESLDEHVELARRTRLEGGSVEDVLTALRAGGASQATSLAAIREVESGTLGEWKQILDQSETWADQRASNETLRDEVIEAVEEPDSDDPR